MKDNIITYAYRGFLSVIYFLFGKKEKINEMFEVKKTKNSKNDVFKKTKTDYVEKQEKKHFRYKAKNSKGKIINGTFDAYNINQAKRYLSSDDLEIISIKEREKYDVDINIGSPISLSKLSFALTQLATYLKAGMPLVDSFRLLAKQENNKEKKKIYDMIVCDLLSGDNLSEAMEKQKNVFPRLLINMVKSSELTGDLSNVLEEMANYYESIDKTKKEIRSAMTYPSLVFIFSIIVVTFVLVWIVPQYQKMFANYGADLPKITVIIINISNYIRSNMLNILIVIIVVLLIYLYLFKKVRSFKLFMQGLYLRFPVMRKVIMYSEVSMFARTFASLINHGVHITDSMDVLMDVSDNEVYRDIIIKTIDNLNSGGRISDAFKDHYAFPNAAYEMIVTGENTGSLGTMMEKVAEYYDSLHRNIVSSLKSLIEPFLIIFLSGSVGLIILAVILPMFEMYRVIG